MPRHQDNVDIVLVTNPRPLRMFYADFGLDVPDPFARPRWSGHKVGHRFWRTFRAEARRSTLEISMEVVCKELLDVTVQTPFGDERRMFPGDQKLSVFTWKSTADHVVTLSIGAELEGGSLPIACKDPSPTNPIWEFTIGDAAASATFTADFSATLPQPKAPQVASFTATYPR